MTLKTNLYGYFHMAQEALEHMKPGAAIINTGSVTGIDGSKEQVDYSLTKGGSMPSPALYRLTLSTGAFG